MKPVLIQCAGCFGGPDVTGLYLASYDLEARGGWGEFTWTRDPLRALVFLSFLGAYEAWRGQSVTVPLRDDGEPNRPLTAFSVTFADAPVILHSGGPL